MLDTLISELTVGSIITNKFNLDVKFWDDTFVNCQDQLNQLLGTRIFNGTISTTDCLSDEPDPETDPCCSLAAAWSQVCKPRDITGQFEGTLIVDSLLQATCSESACMETFLNDYIESGNDGCADISSTIFNWNAQKGYNFIVYFQYLF
jgi:hypothetical protein